MHQYVQYGCGLCAPVTWRNYDASPTLRLQSIPVLGRLFMGGQFPVFPKNVEYGDIVKGLPLTTGSCRAIYCSHVLEHLALEVVPTALVHTHFYLEHDGIFRFVLPDLEQLAQDYLGSVDPDASHVFMRQSCLGKKSRQFGLKRFLREWLGNSAHLWMWDFKAIEKELQKVGFREIRRAYYGDSQDPQFKEVEDKGRWQNCLGIECVR